MVLVDTSVWIDHFRKNEGKLQNLLYDEQVVIHPFVIGELACGNLKNRTEIFHLLHALPETVEANHSEVMMFINKHKLYGQGLGYVEVHLLASALLGNYNLWTKDKILKGITIPFGVSF